MKRLLFLLALGTSLAWTGCDSGSDDDVFSISMLDQGNEVAFQGELRLLIEEVGSADEPGEVTGRWQLERTGSSTSSSGQVQGTLGGFGLMQLSLEEPDISDSGFGLQGTYDGDTYSGTWSTVTIAGPQPGGTFEAVRE